MTSSSHISADKLTEFALSTLPPSEQHSMQAHFQLCALCREQLRQVNLALAAYGASGSRASISSDARDRFVHRLPITQQAHVAQSSHNFRSFFSFRTDTFKNWFKTGRWNTYLIGALVVSLFWVVITNYRMSTELRLMYAQAHQGDLDSARLNELLDMLTSTHMKRADLREMSFLASQPEGHITYSPQSGKVLFTASSLHTLPVEKTYQLWVLLVGNHAPLSVGIFTPNISGNASLIPQPLPANLPVRSFAISIEEAGGATTPTLPYQLSGE